jgi:hypothetical protein
LRKRVAEIHRLAENDRPAGLRPACDLLHHAVQVSEQVMKNGVGPDDVEFAFLKCGCLEWGDHERGAAAHPVDLGAALRDLDRPRRDVDARDLRAEQREIHRVETITTSDVEHLLAGERAEQAEAVFLAEPAPPQLSVSLDGSRIDGCETLHGVSRFLVKELRFLFPSLLFGVAVRHSSSTGSTFRPPPAADQCLDDER